MVQCIACPIDLFENALGGGGPDKGLGCLVVFGEIVVDGHLQFEGALENAAADGIPGDLGEKRSTWFSQDAAVGVKWTWNRGCLSSHFLTLACLCVV